MKSTPERVEAIDMAVSVLSAGEAPSHIVAILEAMLSECEQELPQPLVFDAENSSHANFPIIRFAAAFNRELVKDDCDAIRAVLTKAFPA